MNILSTGFAESPDYILERGASFYLERFVIDASYSDPLFVVVMKQNYTRTSSRTNVICITRKHLDAGNVSFFRLLSQPIGIFYLFRRFQLTMSTTMRAKS
jgi:hypothetical protein